MVAARVAHVDRDAISPLEDGLGGAETRRATTTQPMRRRPVKPSNNDVVAKSHAMRTMSSSRSLVIPNRLPSYGRESAAP
jgi:hypothetical protein